MIELIVHVGLFNFGLALVGRAGDGVLPLHLTIESELIGEAMTEEQNKAFEIRLITAGVLTLAVEADFAVSANGRIGGRWCHIALPLNQSASLRLQVLNL